MSELVMMTDDNMNVAQSPKQDFQAEGIPAMKKNNPMRFLLPILFVAIVAGVGTGYALSSTLTPGSKGASNTAVTESGGTLPAADQVVAGESYGSTDSSTFSDSAEGIILVGGLSGEGSHRIVREGGVSQNVYLTSSIVDLKRFENHKVIVKGETFKAQRAGWLMDVGQIKVVELNATLPAWAQKELEDSEKSAGNGN